METDLVLRVEQLTKNFGLHTVINAVSFELQQGEILGLLGTNGAGKTTIIQMLLSTMTPTSGAIYYFGKNLARFRSEVMQHVSFASAYVTLHAKLTVYENVDFYAQLYGLSSSDRKVRVEYLLKYFAMWDFKDRYAVGLSAGQTTRVMLAKAFVARPKVVLLDEPTASLDPDVAHDVRHFILEQQREQNTSIVFTSHNMDEVAYVCQRVIVLKKGIIIANNTPYNLACSISTTKLRLSISPDQIAAIEFFIVKRGLQYTKEESVFEIVLEENQIGQFLKELAREDISYCQIGIDKPTLEDYFLHISKK
jgi:ABC-2 type transport system ATP-binding protein